MSFIYPPVDRKTMLPMTFTRSANEATTVAKGGKRREKNHRNSECAITRVCASVHWLSTMRWKIDFDNLHLFDRSERLFGRQIDKRRCSPSRQPILRCFCRYLFFARRDATTINASWSRWHNVIAVTAFFTFCLWSNCAMFNCFNVDRNVNNFSLRKSERNGDKLIVIRFKFD